MGDNRPANPGANCHLDEGIPNFTSELSNQASADMPQSVDLAGVKSMGEVLIAILQSSDFTDLITLTIAPDEMSARAAVDVRQAGGGCDHPGRLYCSTYGSGNPGDCKLCIRIRR